MTTEYDEFLKSFHKLSVDQLFTIETQARRSLKQHKVWRTDRPDWDTYFCNIALAVSERGSCVRRRVGAVLVDSEHNILSTGYNGKGATLTNCAMQPCSGAVCSSGSGLEGCEAIHAEVNALIRCSDRSKIDTVYVTCSPCTNCVDILLGTSAKRIVFMEQYAHNDESWRRWTAAGREWVHFNSN